MSYTQDQEFNGNNFSKEPLAKGDYDNCTFVNCNFAEADLREIAFEECEFIDCDLSMAKLINTAFREVSFKNCKMLGLHFETCDDFRFELRFTDCTLNLSSFYQRKLAGTNFIDCKLHEVDFVEADLSNGVFDNCDLGGATFESTNLENANFSTAFNFTIDPTNNRLRRAKFSKENLMGLLARYDLVIR